MISTTSTRKPKRRKPISQSLIVGLAPLAYYKKHLKPKRGQSFEAALLEHLQKGIRQILRDGLA